MGVSDYQGGPVWFPGGGMVRTIPRANGFSLYFSTPPFSDHKAFFREAVWGSTCRGPLQEEFLDAPLCNTAPRPGRP